jgi:hypothetical protein
MTIKYFNGLLLGHTIIKYSKISNCKTLQNLFNLGFLVSKRTIWQPWAVPNCFYFLIQVYLLKPLPRRSPAWFHFNYAKMVDEFSRVTSGDMSGVQVLADFADAEVGPDGTWLTTASWRKLLDYIFAEAQLEPQVL